MFRKKQHKRRTSFLPFVIFRLGLSLTIFMILLGGLYYAFQYFSGVDPSRIDPKVVLASLISSRETKSFIDEILSGKKPTTIPLSFRDNSDEQTQAVLPTTREQPKSHNKKVSFSFLLVADSHNENNYLARALEQGKKDPSVTLVIGLGDYTEIGTLDELEAAKQEFDKGGLRYFVTAGDHDLWDSRDKQKVATSNFVDIFASPFHVFSTNNIKMIIINNSDNYLGLGEDQMQWLKTELDKEKVENNALTFVFLHEPLYHPSSTRVMGKVEPKLKEEAKNLINMFTSAGVEEVFAGDIHYFTSYDEPQTKLKMTTVGALTSARNTQSPRYAKVVIFDDGSYEVEDIEVK